MLMFLSYLVICGTALIVSAVSTNRAVAAAHALGKREGYLEAAALLNIESIRLMKNAPEGKLREAVMVASALDACSAECLSLRSAVQ